MAIFVRRTFNSPLAVLKAVGLWICKNVHSPGRLAEHNFLILLIFVRSPNLQIALSALNTLFTEGRSVCRAQIEPDQRRCLDEPKD